MYFFNYHKGIAEEKFFELNLPNDKNMQQKRFLICKGEKGKGGKLQLTLI